MLFTRKQINEFFPSLTPKPKSRRSKYSEIKRQSAANHRQRIYDYITDLERKILQLQPDFVIDRPVRKKPCPPKLLGMHVKERNKIHAAEHRKRKKAYMTFLKETLSSLECRA